MKTGNHDQGVILDNKKQRVREMAQETAANIPKHGGKLPGIIADSLDQSVDCLPETPAKPGGFALIPILSLDQLGPRGLSKDDRIHYGQRCSSSALRDAHVTPLRLSSPSELRRRSSSASCASVKGSCSCSRLSQSCAMSARRSGGVKRTISSGVSDSTLLAYRKKGRGARPHTDLTLAKPIGPRIPRPRRDCASRAILRAPRRSGGSAPGRCLTLLAWW